MQIHLNEDAVRVLQNWIDRGDGEIVLTYSEGLSGRGLYVSLGVNPKEAAALVMLENQEERFQRIEREHLGDPEKRTGIYAAKVLEDHTAGIDALRRGADEIYAIERDVILEEAAQAAEMVFGGKSHKVSENSDTYAIQDHAVEQCAAAIRALKRPR